MRIDSGVLPNRGPIVLDRERRVLPMMILRLENRPKASPDGALKRLTIDLLRKGFAERQATRLPAAAFLAGRCDSSDAAELDEALAEVIAELDVARLGSMAPSYVESAMSLGLRGDRAAGTAALTGLVAGGGVGSSHDSLAAFYLAQYGDPGGWPALLGALASDDPHTRLMATRNLFVFMAFDGQQVDGETIDVGARLAERLDDESAYVAVEVPGLLAESAVAGFDGLIRDAADSARHEEVRRAAADVLTLIEDPTR